MAISSQLTPSADVRSTIQYFPVYGAQSSVGQGTWAEQFATDIGFPSCSLDNSGTHNDADNITFSVFLPKGIYKIRWHGFTWSNQGILKVDVAGTTKYTLDLYGVAGALVKGVTDITGATAFTIASAGATAIKIKVDGKNAGSSDYRVNVGCLEFVPQ